MAVVSTLLNGVVKKKRANFERKLILSQEIQDKVLLKLLMKARNTDFGLHYNFEDILFSDRPVLEFQKRIPLFTYEKMYDEWWHRFFSGDQNNISWPGKVRYFGLTSGTSNASSKRVPITTAMIKSIRKVGIRQLLALSEFDLPRGFYQKSVLMLGGSTELVKMESYFEGDLSGIMAGKLPFWFNRWYKPGKPIAREKDWTAKLEQMVKAAPKWDIGGISGVPAWFQILLQMIIDRYQLNNIHDIWPNFRVFVHGGVNFEPYRKSFEKLLGRPVYYLETYLASEGFLAFQKDQGSDMQLVIDNGVFYEFVPFNNENFNADGQIVDNPQIFTMKDVEDNVDYALLISTNSGVWRYLIGDTIKFTNKEQAQIKITGRTKHFLSLCGEHLSVDNITRAVAITCEKLGFNSKEFTVFGVRFGDLFAHQWYLATDNMSIDPLVVKDVLDSSLMELNDDYKTERGAALKDIFVRLIPVDLFYGFMKSKGKEGGQHKFPRVLNGLEKDWEKFLKSSGY